MKSRCLIDQTVKLRASPASRKRCHEFPFLPERDNISVTLSRAICQIAAYMAAILILKSEYSHALPQGGNLNIQLSNFMLRAYPKTYFGSGHPPLIPPLYV